MRAAAVLLIVPLLGGCLEDEPAPESRLELWPCEWFCKVVGEGGFGLPTPVLRINEGTDWIVTAALDEKLWWANATTLFEADPDGLYRILAERNWQTDLDSGLFPAGDRVAWRENGVVRVSDGSVGPEADRLLGFDGQRFLILEVGPTGPQIVLVDGDRRITIIAWAPDARSPGYLGEVIAGGAFDRDHVYAALSAGVSRPSHDPMAATVAGYDAATDRVMILNESKSGYISGLLARDGRVLWHEWSWPRHLGVRGLPGDPINAAEPNSTWGIPLAIDGSWSLHYHCGHHCHLGTLYETNGGEPVEIDRAFYRAFGGDALGRGESAWPSSAVVDVSTWRYNDEPFRWTFPE